MNSVNVREKLVEALRLDLVGPAEKLGDSAEVLPQAPSRWYLTGYLAPALEDAVAAIDPGAEHVSEAPCPACGASSSRTARPSRTNRKRRSASWRGRWGRRLRRAAKLDRRHGVRGRPTLLWESRPHEPEPTPEDTPMTPPIGRRASLAIFGGLALARHARSDAEAREPDLAARHVHENMGRLDVLVDKTPFVQPAERVRETDGEA